MMTEILAVLSNFIIAVISGGGYAGIVLLMGIESACIPLPSEVIMPFSGYLVAQGRFTLLWVATAGAIGCNAGSAVAYWVGYFGGRRLVLRYGHPLRRRHGFCRPPAAGDPHLHRLAGWRSPHAAGALPRLHFSRLLAVVFCPGLFGDEGRRALGLSPRVLSQIRRGHRLVACQCGGVVRVVPLEAPRLGARLICSKRSDAPIAIRRLLREDN